MLNYSNARINSLVIHDVGNKLRDEGCELSSGKCSIEKEMRPILISYFLSSFRTPEFFAFHHESDLSLNNVYTFVDAIFKNKASFLEKSKQIAKHLYEHSIHPKIEKGEVYVVYFTDCVLDDEVVDAIGIFKSENKEAFLKIERAGGRHEVFADEGISTAKLDKGCLIYNLSASKGYQVSIIDNLGRGSEAQYWKDHFLRLEQAHDEYHHTQNYLRLCKDFITKKLPEEFEVTRTEQIEMLNNSAEFFSEHDQFDLKKFAKEVIKDTEIAKSFRNYKSEYEAEKDIALEDGFEISAAAVKKQSKVFRSVLKLDNNFHVYVHGDATLIEKGYDKGVGKSYYKLYFDDEK